MKSYRPLTGNNAQVFFRADVGPWELTFEIKSTMKVRGIKCINVAEVRNQNKNEFRVIFQTS